MKTWHYKQSKRKQNNCMYKLGKKNCVVFVWSSEIEISASIIECKQSPRPSYATTLTNAQCVPNYVFKNKSRLKYKKCLIQLFGIHGTMIFTKFDRTKLAKSFCHLGSEPFSNFLKKVTLNLSLFHFQEGTAFSCYKCFTLFKHTNHFNFKRRKLSGIVHWWLWKLHREKIM